MSGTHDTQMTVDRIARVVASSIQHNHEVKRWIQNQPDPQLVASLRETLEEDCVHLRAQLKARLLGLKTYKEYREALLVMMQNRNHFNVSVNRRIGRDRLLYHEVTKIMTSVLINDVMPLMLGNPRMIMQSIDRIMKYLNIITWSHSDVDDLPDSDDFEHVLHLNPGALDASERIAVTKAVDVLNNWAPVPVQRRASSDATERDAPEDRDLIPYDGARDSVSRQAARIAEKAAKEQDRRNLSFDRGKILATPTPSVSSFAATDEKFPTRASTPWTPTEFRPSLAGPSSSESHVMGTTTPTTSAMEGRPNVVEGLLQSRTFWEPPVPPYEPPDVGSPFARYTGLPFDKGKSSDMNPSVEKKKILDAASDGPRRSSRLSEWVDTDRLLSLFDANPLYTTDYVFGRKDVPVRWRVTSSSFVADEEDACWAEVKAELPFDVLAPLLQCSLLVEHDGTSSADRTLEVLTQFIAQPESIMKREPYAFHVIPDNLSPMWTPSFNTFKVVGGSTTKKSRSLLFTIRGRIDLGVLKEWLTCSRGRVE